MYYQEGEKTAFQVGPYVSWDLSYSSWEQLPPSQKWFAVGETVPYLRYLEGNKMIQRKTKEQRILFSLA